MSNGERTARFGLVDLALLSVVLIWAVNFTVVKAALRHIPPLAFNVVRLTGASALLLALVVLHRLIGARPGGRHGFPVADIGRLTLLGLLGHTLYQLFFIFGVDMTTASNSALILGTTPVAVAGLSALAGLERPGPTSWIGILLTVLGVRLVMGPSESGGRLAGDVLVLAATLCWAGYTVASKPLLVRYSPLELNAYSMTIGTAFFLVFGFSDLRRLSLETIPTAAWLGTVFSFVFALSVAYALYVHGIARVGPTRAAAYSNLTPLVAIVFASLTLGESLTGAQWVGAAVLLVGVICARGGRVLERARSPGSVDPATVNR